MIMHQVQLSDQLYQQAQRRAAEAGFPSVDEYVADIVQHDVADEIENLDHFFTPQRLEHIDQSIAQIQAGQGLTSEQAKAELARRGDEWLRQNAR
jgi:hypothetical protein